MMMTNKMMTIKKVMMMMTIKIMKMSCTRRKEAFLTHEHMPMSCVSWLNLMVVIEVCRFMSDFCGLGVVLRVASVSAEYMFTTPDCDLQRATITRRSAEREQVRVDERACRGAASYPTAW
jgi:hypothetical protein